VPPEERLVPAFEHESALQTVQLGRKRRGRGIHLPLTYLRERPRYSPNHKV
jgi:hypothetical protein